MCRKNRKTEKTKADLGDLVSEGMLETNRFLFEFLPRQALWLRASGLVFLLSVVGLLLVYPPQDVALNVQYPLAVAILLYFGVSFREFERSQGEPQASRSWWRAYPGPLLIMYGSFLYGWFNYFMPH